ncbi:hypothetical protein ACSVH2_08770 [Flavobacterium sp. RSB2_4_14]|uniref:hypothetical protein n=1 Tax=Flavobacterium sp. RSB2_4_14 TaxID=3447665 RepID=UPI003F2F9788
MNSEQQKLIQQLLQMGDVNLFNRKKETVVKAITEMDMVSLELILDENLTYQDASKEMFLNKLKEIFDELKKSNDTLQSHSGKCGSKECSNHNKNGMLFCGRNSGKHFNVIIEEDENENVMDLYYCNAFKCNFEDKANKSGKSLNIEIYEDEKANFQPNSYYININTTSLRAITYLNNFKNKTISKNELLAWLQEYFEFYSSTSILNIKYKNENKFHHYYYRAEVLKKYLILEEDCKKAMRLYDTLLEDYEMNMLKWLAEHEGLKNEMILFYSDFADEKTGELKQIIFNQELNISINIDYLKNCIRFQDTIDTNYYTLFDKFKVEIETKEGVPLSGEEIEKHISLKYHLEQRNFFVNKINYKKKLGKNSFLYGNEDFGNLEKGVS